VQRVQWKEGDELDVEIKEHVERHIDVAVDEQRSKEERAVRIDMTTHSVDAVEFGKETLMVNASIMTVKYKPWNAPFLVDLDLERAD
jgi:hypothetical protein